MHPGHPPTGVKQWELVFNCHWTHFLSEMEALSVRFCVSKACVRWAADSLCAVLAESTRRLVPLTHSSCESQRGRQITPHNRFACTLLIALPSRCEPFPGACSSLSQRLAVSHWLPLHESAAALLWTSHHLRGRRGRIHSCPVGGGVPGVQV